VPLADGDATTCPYCSAAVPIPEDLRQLRRELAALTGEREAAERLYRRLGRPPPQFLRAFTFFESGWFWMFLAGFWISGALAAFVIGTPIVGAVVFHVNTPDVLTQGQESMISIGGSLGSIVLGLLLAGWSHKRVVSRRGLQAAMTAAPPHAAGGPARCRVCGSALAVADGAFGARCDYCRADNLVRLPPELFRGTRRVVQTLSKEKDAAIVAEAKARSSLRWSLFWRLLIGGGGTALVALPIGAAADNSPSRDLINLYAAPDSLPTWSRADVPHFECDPNAEYLGYPMRLGRCQSGTCEDAYLVALVGRRPFHVFVRGGPPELEITLDGRWMGMLSAHWQTVGRATPVDGQVTIVPPLSGWYRLRIAGGDTPSRIQWCGSQE
jgi:hypothetical protein